MPQIHGVSKARDIRLNTEPMNKLEAVGKFGYAISDAIVKGSKVAAQVKHQVTQKVETIRVAKSQEYQDQINEKYRQMQLEVGNLPSGEIADWYDEEFNKDDEDETSEEFDSLDPITKQEVNEYERKRREQFKNWVVNRIISKSGEANIEALKRTMISAKRDINIIPAGDLNSISESVDGVVEAHIKRNPTLSDESIAQFRSGVTEELLTTAIDKWSSENATTMVRIWNENPAFFKEALPTSYAKVSKDMVRVTEKSNWDVAVQLLRNANGDDFGAYVTDLTTAFNDKNSNFYNLTNDQYIEMIKEFSVLASAQISHEDKLKTQREKAYLEDFYDKYFVNGAWNVQAALTAIKEADEKDTESANVAAEIRKNIYAGSEYTPEDNAETIRMINMDEIPDTQALLKHRAGKNVDPSIYASILQKRQQERDRGLISNYYKEAQDYYMYLAQIKIARQLPSGIADKNILVDRSEITDFMRRLQDRAALENLSAGNPRVYDIAKEMLEVGRYDVASPEVFEAGNPVEGNVESLKNFFTRTYINTRAWKHNQMFPDTQVIEREGKKAQGETGIHHSIKTAKGIPQGELKELNEIATSGNPEQKAAIRKILELQSEGRKISLTLSNVQRVIAIMKREAGQGVR